MLVAVFFVLSLGVSSYSVAEVVGNQSLVYLQCEGTHKVANTATPTRKGYILGFSIKEPKKIINVVGESLNYKFPHCGSDYRNVICRAEVAPLDGGQVHSYLQLDRITGSIFEYIEIDGTTNLYQAGVFEGTCTTSKTPEF